MFQKLHHVAYRCRDAQETVEFYTKVLGLKYAAGEQSPEGARPYGEEVDLIHIFFECGDGSYIAFFDLPSSPPMQADQVDHRGICPCRHCRLARAVSGGRPTMSRCHCYVTTLHQGARDSAGASEAALSQTYRRPWTARRFDLEGRSIPSSDQGQRAYQNTTRTYDRAARRFKMSEIPLASTPNETDQAPRFCPPWRSIVTR